MSFTAKHNTSLEQYYQQFGEIYRQCKICTQGDFDNELVKFSLANSDEDFVTVIMQTCKYCKQIRFLSSEILR